MTGMDVLVWIGVPLLAVAGLLALLRIALGPTMLNRAVGLDVLTATLVAGLAIEAAYHRHTTTLPILVVVSLIGFVGTVSMSRFALREDKEDR